MTARTSYPVLIVLGAVGVMACSRPLEQSAPAAVPPAAQAPTPQQPAAAPTQPPGAPPAQQPQPAPTGAAPARPTAPASFPTTPPAPTALTPATFPPFVEFELPNLLRIVLVPSTKQPVVTLSLSVNAGGIYDPAGKSGTAELLAAVLTKGAGDRSAEAIAETIERVGGSLSASAGADFLTVTTSVLADDRELAFQLLSDVLQRPTLPESEIALARQQMLSGLALERSQPDAIAARAFVRTLYGEHPYGRRPTPESVQSITRDELLAFHRGRVRPHQGVLVIAGAVDSTEAVRLVTRYFDAWVGEMRPLPPLRPAPQRQRTEIVLVDRPGSVQANIVVGNTTWQPTDTRSYALALGSQILGGGADARLFSILREEKGWTYGAYSGVTRYRGLGYFEATAEVRNEVADSALVELMRQLQRMSTEPVPVDEFERSKQTIIGRFPLQVETAAQVAAQVANARLLNLATDYVQTYRQRVAALTPEQVQAAARSGMRADGALVVVVGDGQALKPLLAPIAPVTMVDLDGNVIPEDSATVVANAAPVALDKTRMMATSDSFAVMVQGREFGFQTFAWTRVSGGWEFREASMLGPIIQQQTSVRVTDSLEMRTMDQTGRFQGQDIQLRVRYAGGHAGGDGMTPSGQGAMQPVQYANVAIPADVIDESALPGLLPLLAWTPDARFSVNVFLSGRGRVERREFRVIGEEVVTVPAGSFATYKVSGTGGEAAGTYWIEVAVPHRIIKFGPATVPMELVRVR